MTDGWAGAIMQKPLAIQKCYRGTDATDRPSDMATCRVAWPRLKQKVMFLNISYASFLEKLGAVIQSTHIFANL